MAKVTKREMLCRILEAKGHTEIPSRSGKYLTYQEVRADGAEGRLYFVGKSGALRYGVCATKSYSLDADKIIAFNRHLIDA